MEDLTQVPAARELTPTIREHLQGVLAMHGVPDEVRPPVGSAAPNQPHVVGAGLPSLAIGGLSSLLTSTVVQFVLAQLVSRIQAEVVPPLLAALREVARSHPDFDPNLILAPINKLLAYLGGSPIVFSAR